VLERIGESAGLIVRSTALEVVLGLVGVCGALSEQRAVERRDQEDRDEVRAHVSTSWMNDAAGFVKERASGVDGSDFSRKERRRAAFVVTERPTPMPMPTPTPMPIAFNAEE